MASPKTEKFQAHQISLARLAKALSHPARVAIVEHLLVQRSCICGDIVDALPLSQSTVSQHLSELKSAGIIQGTIDGPRVCYCINVAAWEEAGNILNAFFNRSSEASSGGSCC